MEVINISNEVISLSQVSNNKPKYDKEKWKKIMDTTQSNYANMIKRLTRKSKFSNFILIYYSIFLIITTLTCKYFSDYYNVILSEYFSIILSIVVLAYSNGFALYTMLTSSMPIIILFFERINSNSLNESEENK